MSMKKDPFRYRKAILFIFQIFLLLFVSFSSPSEWNALLVSCFLNISTSEAMPDGNSHLPIRISSMMALGISKPYPFLRIFFRITFTVVIVRFVDMGINFGRNVVVVVLAEL